MPNHFSGNDDGRGAHAVETAASRHLADHGLTLSQFAVLEALYHLGPLASPGTAEPAPTGRQDFAFRRQSDDGD